MHNLGLTISDKKLVEPTTQAVCLGVLIDTVEGTIAIPPNKLENVHRMIDAWSTKKHCTKKQLQSLLGHMLYIHKCVKPARCFVNCMLDVLHHVNNPNSILITDEFHRDIRWFKKFLPQYNGISIYGYKKISQAVELDACLTGLGAVWGRFVYHLKIPEGYRNMGIVHLEMVNILVAIRIFAQFWAKQCILIRCDNQAVVSVLQSGRAWDPFLGACARNIWYAAALNDVDFSYIHILGKYNRAADLLSRWTASMNDVTKLNELVSSPIWVPTSMSQLELDDSL